MERPWDLSIPVDEETQLLLQRERDAEEYLALIEGDRQRLRTFMEWVDQVKKIEDELAFLAEREREYQEGRGLPMSVWHRDRIVGAVGTVTLDRVNDSAEVGYFVVGGHEGRGLMGKAVSAFVDHLFREEGMNWVSARIMITNDRSRTLVERLGFKLEGVHRQEYKLRGEHQDLTVHSILRSEWERGAGGTL